MNLINDFLKLKAQQEHDSQILYDGVFTEIALILDANCRLNEEVKNLKKRIELLENKE